VRVSLETGGGGVALDRWRIGNTPGVRVWGTSVEQGWRVFVLAAGTDPVLHVRSRDASRVPSECGGEPPTGPTAS